MKAQHLWCLLVLGCSGAPVVPVAVEPGDTDKCHAACLHLQQLKCEEGDTLADGTTCEQFCVATQKAGHALNPYCVMSIERCADISKCSQTRTLGQ